MAIDETIDNHLQKIGKTHTVAIDLHEISADAIIYCHYDKTLEEKTLYIAHSEKDYRHLLRFLYAKTEECALFHWQLFGGYLLSKNKEGIVKEHHIPLLVETVWNESDTRYILSILDILSSIDEKNHQDCIRYYPKRRTLETITKPNMDYAEDAFLLTDPKTVQELSALPYVGGRLAIDLSLLPAEEDNKGAYYPLLFSAIEPLSGQAVILELCHADNYETDVLQYMIGWLKRVGRIDGIEVKNPELIRILFDLAKKADIPMELVDTLPCTQEFLQKNFY